jgi:hypothetical protein
MPIIPEKQNVDQLDAEKQRALERKIDADIEAARVLIFQRHDRRGPVRPHEPEQRGGIERRARVAKEDT